MTYAAGPTTVLSFFFSNPPQKAYFVMVSHFGPMPDRQDFAQVVLISTDVNLIRVITGQAL